MANQPPRYSVPYAGDPDYPVAPRPGRKPAGVAIATMERAQAVNSATSTKAPAFTKAGKPHITSKYLYKLRPAQPEPVEEPHQTDISSPSVLRRSLQALLLIGLAETDCFAGFAELA